MKFELHTLVDITETNARFNKNSKDWQQQQNYMTCLQTIGLRVNPVIDKLSYEQKDIKGLGFGKKYKDVQQIWTLKFHIEYENATDIDKLTTDFNLVPIITGLNETIDFKNKSFITDNKDHTNIIFNYVD